MALLSLGQLAENQAHNKELREAYQSKLPIMDTQQYIVLETERQQEIVQRLAEHGYEAKTYFKPLADLPNTTRISQNVIQLPHGQHVTVEDVEKICDLV